MGEVVVAVNTMIFSKGEQKNRKNRLNRENWKKIIETTKP